MKQYSEVKAKYPGTILLFRMGDFFETFDEDAKVTSRVLGITLTRARQRRGGRNAPCRLSPSCARYLSAEAAESRSSRCDMRAARRPEVCQRNRQAGRDRSCFAGGCIFGQSARPETEQLFWRQSPFPLPWQPATTFIGFSYVDISTGEFATAGNPFRALEQQIQFHYSL